MKRAVLYTRVSSVDQHPETQLCDLRPLAAARGYEIVGEYNDTISGSKAKRPALDQLMADPRRGRFDVVLVWAFDRVARSVKHFLEILDDLNRLNVERSEEHTSELQSLRHLVCRLLLEKKK